MVRGAGAQAAKGYSPAVGVSLVETQKRPSGFGLRVVTASLPREGVWMLENIMFCCHESRMVLVSERRDGLCSGAHTPAQSPS